MENLKPYKSKARADPLKPVYELMSSEEGTHVRFNRVNLEGRNVGASMHVRPRDAASEQQEDRCSINIYISNNIQGVNNSILVGSDVKMAEPGLGLSFGDVVWERETPERSNMEVNRRMSSVPITSWFDALLICALVVLAFAVAFALFGPGIARR